jgi:carbon monoxide dehydrogenase subunit G
LKYENYSDDPRYTHFVAEVVEGGSATLSFVQSYSSAEEANRFTGELKISIVKIPVSGTAKVNFSEEEKSIFENVRISYSGAMVENVSNLEDARRVASEMPTKLAKQLNKLSYKLLPLSVSDSRAR